MIGTVIKIMSIKYKEWPYYLVGSTYFGWHEMKREYAKCKHQTRMQSLIVRDKSELPFLELSVGGRASLNVLTQPPTVLLLTRLSTPAE